MPLENTLVVAKLHDFCVNWLIKAHPFPSTFLPRDVLFVRKLLLFPLRLSIGWGLSPRLLGLIGVTTLVLLRLAVGWHFYSEGLSKQGGNWSAAPFFANAKGPLAGEFRKMVWDADGTLRLDRDATMLNFAIYRDQIASHYGFDEGASKLAQQNYAASIEQYDWILATNESDLEEFRAGRERIKLLDTDRHEKSLRDGVSSLGEQRETIRREWMAKAAPTLKTIDRLWENYEETQNQLATSEQRQTSGRFALRQPPTHLMDTSVVDRILPYFDLVVGLCLLLGLFTPVAALAAAVFLGSVFLSQFPPQTGPSSSNYQLIESMACLVLAATGAGRFAGLDYFLHLLVRTTHTKNAKIA